MKVIIALLSVFLCFFLDLGRARNLPEGYYYPRDGVVTHWPTSTSKSSISQESSLNSPQKDESSNNEPGWLRKQLLRFGQVASKIGNSMGGHASKITAALDKICEVIKTVIPLLAAVCHVGEFGFCTATNEAPVKLAEAMNPNDLNLDSLDR